MAPRTERARRGTAAVLVACEATPPDPSESERTEVAAAPRVAGKLTEAARVDTTNVQAVAGAPVAVAKLAALPSKVPGKVRVDSITTGAPTRVEIRVKVPAPVAPESDSALTQVARPKFLGLIFIDGVRATEAEMKALDRTRIEAIEVFKGAAAAQYDLDPKAANGVIVITTKQ